MNESFLLPLLVFLPFLGSLISYCIGRKNELARDIFAWVLVISEFAVTVGLFLMYNQKVGQEAILDCYIPEICGMGIGFTLDGFRLIYVVIAALMWMMTTLLSREYFAHHENRNRFYTFLLLTLGATMGVFLSADLYTTFIFFEIMAFTSYVWVAQEENGESLRAAATYLAVAIIGGLVMLMGIFLLYNQLGTVKISELMEVATSTNNETLLYSVGVCLLVGFGAKAGAFPLHVWLPKAHPVAPAPASALLSGILTKTGVFGILVVSSNMFFHDPLWGKLILTLGVITMFGGALLAVFSIDLKRTLACSSMSQIGFIMVGIGMQGIIGEDNGLAVDGTFVHMINHSLIKLLLFMIAGVIYMNAHALDLNDIRGFGRKKGLLKVLFLIGALAIAGIPMFSGYISKTLLHESIVEYHGGTIYTVVEWIFLVSGGLTLAYMTKLFVAIFVEKNKDEKLQAKYDEKKKYMNPISGIAVTVSGIILFVWGLFPHAVIEKVAAMGDKFMHFVGHRHEVHYFNWINLKGAVITLVIGSLVYFLVIRLLLMKEGNYVNRWPKWFDMENLIYRPILLGVLPFIGGVIARVCDSFMDTVVVILRKTIYKDTPAKTERIEGNVVTDFLGNIMNFFTGLVAKIKRNITGKEPAIKKDYVHILAVRYEEFKEDALVIGRSLSFGFMLLGIGLVLTLIYIILI